MDMTTLCFSSHVSCQEISCLEVFFFFFFEIKKSKEKKKTYFTAIWGHRTLEDFKIRENDDLLKRPGVCILS